MAERGSERWVWVDLEMTGLDDKTCCILQIAAIITDENLQEIASMDVVVWQPESRLETMSPFVRKMHTDNGLHDRLRASGTSNEDAERKILELLTAHVPYRRGILAGNSIWQDRRFLIRHMPLVEQYLHYRQIDVSTLKVLSGAFYGQRGLPPTKASTHTALEDIRASIEELKFYRQHILVDEPR
ncbi:MAG: oligoribonuclease [Myxococcota bacterium]